MGFGSVTVMPATSHAKIFFAVEVTAVGDGIELLHARRRLGLVGHWESCDRSVPSLVTSCMAIR